MTTRLSESDARTALRDHLREKAALARARHGSLSGEALVRAVLADPDLLRYPTSLSFDAAPLRPGEFACALPLAEHPGAGYTIFVHPCFRDRPDLLPALVAYHVPPINYADMASPDDCEHFGAALLGMNTDDYYRLLCDLADAVPAPPSPGAPPA
jgi:hypothetical protein